MVIQQGNSTAICNYIDAGNIFLVISHKSPDADGICSSLALVSFLQRMGKQAYALNEGPLIDSDICMYAHEVYTGIPAALDDVSASDIYVLYVDCADSTRIGSIAYLLNDAWQQGIIDHHVVKSVYTQHVWTDSRMPSTSLMVHSIIEQYGVPTEYEAKLIAKGFITDTEYFHFLPSSASDIFAQLGRLSDNGVSYHALYHELYDTLNYHTIRMLSSALAQVRSYNDDSVAMLRLDYALYQNFIGAVSVSHIVYELLFRIAQTQIIVFLREKEVQCWSCSLRSRHNTYDVSALAQQFGGGGHINAAGFYIEQCTGDEIEAQLHTLLGITL